MRCATKSLSGSKSGWVCLLAVGALFTRAETGSFGRAVPESKSELAEPALDLRAFIAGALAARSRTIVIPPGRYRVKPASGSHLRFQDLQNLEIIATNVEMVCGATVQAIGFERCTNVTLRGLTIDYDPLPFTQGEIVALGPEKSWVEFELFEGYPDNELVERIEIFDPVTRELRRASHYGWGDFERRRPRRYRISKGPNYRYRQQVDTERVGDLLVTNHRTPERGGPHAVLLTDCSRMTLQEVTLYASPTFGFLEVNCTSSTYRRCRVDRRAPTDDLVKRGQPRIRSLNADAFHSKDAVKGPAIIGCTARYQGDDCVNINGRYHYVSGSRGKLVRIAVFDGKPKIRTGDSVEFLPYSGPRPPDAVVVDMKPDPTPITQDEKALIHKLGLDGRIRAGLLGGRAQFYTLTLDREIALPAGSAICCPLRIGSGFAVKDCDFGHNRSRGILIKASQGEVSGNRIVNSRMAAVLVSPEFWWMEAGCSSDVVIKENVIREIGQTPIRILADGGSGKPLPAGAHRNISVLNNRIEDCPWPLVEANSVTGLTVAGNVWSKDPPLMSGVVKSGTSVTRLQLLNCEETDIRQ